MRAKALIAGVFLVLSACATTPETESPEGIPRAVTTISILSDFVAAVAGDRVEVETIVHVGGDPHTYEPTPSDARQIADADIVFRNGLGLERWLDRMIEATEAEVVTLTDGLERQIQIIVEGDYEGDPDPHMWMDPELARQYVTNAQDALTALLPEHADEFEANTADYLGELDELSGWIIEQVEEIPPENRKLVTTHDAFAYFGERFGFEIVATIWGISTEREPSAEEIAGIVDAVRDSGVSTVFVETTINPAIMNRIAADASAEVGEELYGDSVGDPGSGAETYIGMMRANTLSIVAGLSGQG